MRERVLRRGVVWTLLLCIFIAPVTFAQSGTLTQLLKIFGVGYAVRVFAPQLNELVNTLTINHGARVEQETKVVPILTVGSAAYIGAAQVSGPAEQVAKVEAVAQFEGELYDGVFRVKGLVPVDSIDPREGFRRVDGVGVSALLDLSL